MFRMERRTTATNSFSRKIDIVILCFIVSMSNAIIELSDSDFENELNDQEKNIIELETKENTLAELKVEFDSLIEKKQSKTLIHSEPSEIKFSPKDLHVPEWDGDIVTINAWQKRLNNYFKLTGLSGDQEQLTILLYEKVLPAKFQATLHDCKSIIEVWERLKSKFSYESIPQVSLLKLKEVKPMRSGSAEEMRRVLKVLRTMRDTRKNLIAQEILNVMRQLTLSSKK